ncbi:phosphatase PAP2 family protein [Candidatus Woesearchaeota archaeon]|nr:phosphatase PAP2 family protein [Candidatus Woesearchaeota archaeon]
MKGKNSTVVIAAAGVAALLAASFFFDSTAAGLIGSIQTQQITAAVAFFNKHFFWIYTALLAVTFAAILKATPKEAKGRKILAMTASIIAAMAVTHLLKPAIHRLRPDGMLFTSPLLGNIDYSFPSGHTTAAAAGAFSAPQAFRAVWLAFTVATIFSRVYSNVHFLSDTVGGLIVAFAVTAFVKSKLKKSTATEDNMEIRRQIVHALIGLAIAAFAWKYSRLWHVIFIITAAGLVLSHIIKSAATAKNTTIKKMRSLAVAALRLVERKKELQRFPGKGAIMLFIGAGLTALIFRKEAGAAILILAVGDSVSHLAGRLIGRIKHKQPFIEEKMVEGTVVGFVFAAAAAATILPVWMAILAAAAGMIVEALHLRIGKIKIDDNLTVPLVAAAVLWALGLALY